jgi:LmbE family N-acetylglucosaminyl deacetylase
VKLLNISKDDNILIIAPHPDDESIGCGGLLSMYSNQIDVVIMTDGARGDINKTLKDMKVIRKEELEKALGCVDLRSYTFLDYPDGELVFHSDCMDEIDFERYTKIFVPHYSELHADHRASFEFLIKKIDDNNNIEIYQYETRAAINEDIVALDISSCIQNKLKMIGQYKSQLIEYDYVHFAEALSKYHACKENQKDRYLEVYVRYEHQDKRECDLENKVLTEYRIKNDMLDLWLRLRIDGKKINEFISSRYEDVAIYGYGYFGKLLYKDIVNSGGKVRCVVDRNASILCEPGIRFIHPENVEDVDLLIISNLFEGEIIKNDMITLGYRNVITLRDILVCLKGMLKDS